MLNDEAVARPWLLELARPQHSSGDTSGTAVYDEAKQMTYVQFPVYQLAIDSDLAVGTKKADRETGEDQKGF